MTKDEPKNTHLYELFLVHSSVVEVLYASTGLCFVSMYEINVMLLTCIDT